MGPVVLGHEFLGRIIAAGESAGDLGVGQRVVSGAGVWCGSCQWCLAGRTNLCARYFTLGLQVDGGLAEYVLAPALTCRVVPDGCEDNSAAMAQPLAVALHAVRRSRIEPGQTMAVIGIGGIGALIVGGAARRDLCRLVAIDVDERRLERAAALGATDVVDARTEDPARAVIELCEGVGADVVIEASGAAQSPATALASVRRGGTVVLVGLPKEPTPLDVAGTTLREVNVVTSVAHVCDEDLPDAVEILSTSDLAEIALDRVIGLESLVEDGLAPLAAGEVVGKVLVDPRLS